MIRLIAVLAFTTSMAFATNGGNLIGVGPKSIAMGGTGVAHVNGHLDGIYKNPSLITEKAGTGKVQLEAAGTFLGLSVKANQGAGEVDSKAKGKFIPDFAGTYRLNEEMVVGLGVLPYSGAAFDYSDLTAATGLKAEHTVIRFQPTFAMKPSEHFSFGISPILGYAELGLNVISPVTSTQTATPKRSATAFGGQAGISTRWDKFTAGATYILPIKYKHEGVTDTDAFGPGASLANLPNDDVSLQQPGEIGVGVGYQVMPEWSVTFDYRHIAWANANIYENLGWQNQHVIAFGTQYKFDKVALRAGFNYAKSPVEDVAGETGLGLASLDGHIIYQRSVSLLNVVGFPPISKTHITLGGGYDVSDSFGFDLAFVLAPKSTVTRAGSTPLGAYTFTSEMTQWSVTGGVRVSL